MKESTTIPATSESIEPPAVMRLGLHALLVKGVRYELCDDGVHVQRPGRPELVLSFEDALARAEGQLTFL